MAQPIDEDKGSPARRVPLPSGKQRLLDAAEKLFGTKGFSAVSAAEIAREAGVAHGLLFHHFASTEVLYAEVSKLAAERMNILQAASFKGSTPTDQLRSFLRAHMRAVKQRQGDAIFRSRSTGAGLTPAVEAVWEASRLEAIQRVFEVLGLTQPTKKQRACIRAWIAFHDQLVINWLASNALTETEVINLTIGQLGQLVEGWGTTFVKGSSSG